MKLQTSWQLTVSNPTKHYIEKALRSAPVGESSYVILERKPTEFIQVGIDRDTPTLVEYHDGNLETHYQCSEEGIDLNTIIFLFQSYSQDREEWKNMLSWKKLEFEHGQPKALNLHTPPALPKVLGLMLIGLAAAMLLGIILEPANIQGKFFTDLAAILTVFISLKILFSRS